MVKPNIRKSFSLVFFSFPSRFQMEPKVVLGSQKVLRKNAKKNYFLILGSLIKNVKENQI